MPARKPTEAVRSCDLHRQRYRNRSSHIAIERAVQTDIAAEVTHIFRNDRQPQTRSFLLGGKEGIENPALDLKWNSGPTVGHSDGDAMCRVAVGADFDHAS